MGNSLLAVRDINHKYIVVDRRLYLSMNRKGLINFVKSAITFICTFISNKFGLLSPAMILLIFLMMIDYISGMLASKKEAVEHPGDKEYGWSSRKSIIGIYKKVGYILTILAAISTDYIIYKFVREMGIEYQTKTFFGLLVIVWFLLNEILSILENAGRMGAALPGFLKSILSEIKREIDKYNDK